MSSPSRRTEPALLPATSAPTATFSHSYLDKFYAEVPTLLKEFCQFAYYGGFV